MDHYAPLREQMGGAANLPTLPQVAMRLLKIMHDPRSCAADVARIISQDPPLCAKVLRLANSAYYGCPRSITIINDAVVMLGQRAITTLVVSLSVFNLFEPQRREALFDYRLFWRHCAGCALLARLIAAKASAPTPVHYDEAFCAALLHDIGKIALEHYLHDEFSRALALANTSSLPLFEAERATMGAAHTDIAGWLTDGWGLPAILQIPMVYHHSPYLAPGEQECAALVHVADALCYRCGFAPDVTPAHPVCDQRALEWLGLDNTAIEELFSELARHEEGLDIFLEAVVSPPRTGTGETQN